MYISAMKLIVLIGIFAIAISSSHASIFRKKIPKNVFIIKQHETYKLRAPTGYHQIDDHKKALRFLRKSCSSVEKLTLFAEFMPIAERVAISQSIAKHCSNLIELELFEADGALISNTTQTFPKVVSLKVNNFILPENIQISRIYPALQKLSIRNFPGEPWTDNNWEYIRQMLPSISHIRHLRIDGDVNPILQSISESLLNLESLTMQYDGDLGLNESVFFSQVTELNVKVNGIHPKYHPIPFNFDRLQVLRLSVYEPYPFLVDWLMENVELKNITVRMHTNDEFLRAVDRLPKLEHATFELTLELSSDWFLSRMTNVNTVSFATDFGSEKEVILETLPADWEVVDGWKWDNDFGHVVTVQRRTNAIE